MEHSERVQLGHELARQVLDAYGDAVLAIYIYGSTAKSLDRAHSDLELKVVVRDNIEVPDKYYVHRGIVVDIGYRQESGFLKRARSFRADWPAVADQYRHRLPLFEQEGWFRKLDEAVAESDKADSADALRVAAVDLTESLLVLRNAILVGDERIIRDRCRVIAGDAAGLVMLLNRRYVQGTSRFWDQAFECPEQPEDFRHLIDIASGFAGAATKETAEAAERLCAAVLDMVRRRGVSIESVEPLV